MQVLYFCEKFMKIIILFFFNPLLYWINLKQIIYSYAASSIPI